MKLRFFPMNGSDHHDASIQVFPELPFDHLSIIPMNILLFTLLFLQVCLTSPVLAENTPPGTPVNPPQEQRYDSVEERRIMEAIKASGNNQTMSEQEDLERRKKELKRLENEVDKKIEQLNQLRTMVEKLLKQKDAEEQKRIIELAKMYEKMPADKGATVIGNIDIDLAISILSKMKTKSAAKILSNMNREKAAKITTAFSTLDSR